MVSKTLWVSKLPVFARTLDTTEVAVVKGWGEALFGAIVYGSLVTGSPGQPTDLRDADPSTGKDWVLEYPTPTSAIIGNADKSARSVEDGISYKYGTPLTKLHSDEGGFHSLSLAHANADKLLPEVIASVRKA